MVREWYGSPNQTRQSKKRGDRYNDKRLIQLDKMVRLGGLEPPTSGSTIRRSNQLSYNRINLAARWGATLASDTYWLLVLQGES
ncbi:hypothetical protein RHIZ404_230468 [Rhizobium sp. EC-SD404]|nr:hypothetical protein RHIZ404_230468 [Rhizobium sp. EC-SD404]